MVNKDGARQRGASRGCPPPPLQFFLKKLVNFTYAWWFVVCSPRDYVNVKFFFSRQRLRRLPLLSKRFYQQIPCPRCLWRMFYIGLNNPNNLLLNYVVARAVAVSPFCRNLALVSLQVQLIFSVYFHLHNILFQVWINFFLFCTFHVDKRSLENLNEWTNVKKIEQLHNQPLL